MNIYFYLLKYKSYNYKKVVFLQNLFSFHAYSIIQSSIYIIFKLNYIKLITKCCLNSLHSLNIT